MVLRGDRRGRGKVADVHAPLAGTVEAIDGKVDIRVL